LIDEPIIFRSRPAEADEGTCPPLAHLESSSGSLAPGFVAPRALGLFSDQLLQGLVIQCEVGHETFQARILMLELA